MTELSPYTGDDPLLRWYADNGTGWAEARFDGRALAFLRWHEVVDGTPYEVIVDRVPSVEGSLRLLVDVVDLIGGIVDEKSQTIGARCPLTRRLRVGDTTPDHKVTAFTQGSAFFAVSSCGAWRLGVGTAFFTDPRMSGAKARGLAQQVVQTAQKIAEGSRSGRTPAEAILIADSGDRPSVFIDCRRWPWRA